MEQKRTRKAQSIGVHMKQFDHISTHEIIRDIQDTHNEIRIMMREREGLLLMGDRMSQFRADARTSGINERSKFIEKLEKILESRNASSKT